jgi:hypothetical protein
MRWARVITLFCAAALPFAAPAADAPSKPQPIRLVLDLSDGSRIIGLPSIDSLKLATDYSDMVVPLSLVRTLDLTGTNSLALAHFLNGDLLSGHLAATDVSLKTLFGQVLIPISQIRQIKVTTITGPDKSMPDGLVLHYSFDDNDSATVRDLSDGGNDAKIQGATYTSDGKIGGALSFNGDRVAAVIGNPPSLRLQNFTIMAWVKRGNVDKPSARDGEDAELIGYGHAGYMLGMETDGRLFLSKVDFNNIVSQFQITDNTFHHIAVTKQGSHVVCYLDGVGFPPIEYDPGFDFVTDAAIGSRADLLVHSFLGVIDEVAIFNRALSADEIKSVYDSQK